MKKICAGSIVVLFFMTSCYTLNEYVVDYDYSYDGNFPQYDSYNFVQAGNQPDFYNGLIQDAISLRLKSQGYRIKEDEPNLLVLYKIFFEDFYMNGYVQPDLEYWSTTADGNKVPIVYEVAEEEEEEEEELLAQQEASDEELEEGEEEVEDTGDYDPIKCDLREGTLLIAFFDSDGEKSVWQGYASGLFGNKYYNNEKSIRNAVNSILDEYQILADGFVKFDRNN